MILKHIFLYLALKLLDKKIFHEKVICFISYFPMFLGVSNQAYSAVGYNLSTAIIQDSEEMEVTEESTSFTQELKKRFIEGGPSFMGIVLICLILGLAISIERIIFLNLASTNTKKLTEGVEEALSAVV